MNVIWANLCLQDARKRAAGQGKRNVQRQKATRGTATLMNTMGQVIAQQAFNATAGTNEVQLSTSAHGAAILVVKMGSQKNVQKVTLR